MQKEMNWIFFQNGKGLFSIYLAHSRFKNLVPT